MAGRGEEVRGRSPRSYEELGRMGGAKGGRRVRELIEKGRRAEREEE